ncbi:capsid maturation protease [Brevibacterium phage Cantare]|uniref:Capsid maturation protease n=1 Tax=Brevibacterium phage Cantare TaxID=2338395 RepID=A0A3G3LYL7_9CAUD|nr:head maturation protease [Brevibacterium phage Cantare]AYQ99234.1 capsid maturation protease [Brevibacterium phage Cantare]
MGNLQYKGANVSSIQHNDDNGTIRAIVSVTGIEDNVKDIIAPGAYEKSLKTRIPKGVWQHQWTESIAKTTAIKELMPGDPDLPKTLANGQPWPANAGGLLVDMEFNLKTQRGRESYEDVKFFGDQQEWSIGYSVPPGGATKDAKTGVRTIHMLDLYEYSPVLFGAMSNARTTSVKEAQTAYMEMKDLFGDDADRVLALSMDIMTKGDTKPVDDDDEDDLEDIEDDDNDNQPEEKGDNVGNVSNDLIQNAINALQALLNSGEASTEEKGLIFDNDNETKSLYEMMEDAGIEGKILDSADEYDEAIDTGDIELAEKSALAVIDVIEAVIDMGALDEKSDEQYRSFATYIGESLNELQQKSEDPTGEDDDEDDLEDEVPEEKTFQRVVTSNRFSKVETKSAIVDEGLALFEDAEDSDFGF